MEQNANQFYINEKLESAFTTQDITDALDEARRMIDAGGEIAISEAAVNSVIQIGDINKSLFQFLHQLRALGDKVQISESQIEYLLGNEDQIVISSVIAGFHLTDRLIDMCVMNKFTTPGTRNRMLVRNMDRLNNRQLEYVFETLEMNELKILFERGKLPELSGFTLSEELMESTPYMVKNWSSRYVAERDAVKLKGEALGINKSNIFKEKPTCL